MQNSGWNGRHSNAFSRLSAMCVCGHRCFDILKISHQNYFSFHRSWTFLRSIYIFTDTHLYLANGSSFRTSISHVQPYYLMSVHMVRLHSPKNFNKQNKLSKKKTKRKKNFSQVLSGVGHFQSVFTNQLNKLNECVSVCVYCVCVDMPQTW